MTAIGILIWRAIVQGAWGTEVPRGLQGRSPGRGLGTKSSRRRSSLQTLFAGFHRRNNQFPQKFTPRSTQHGHPSVGRRNEYQPKGGDALRLGSKGRYGSCVWQVKLSDPLAIISKHFRDEFMIER